MNDGLLSVIVVIALGLLAVLAVTYIVVRLMIRAARSYRHESSGAYPLMPTAVVAMMAYIVSVLLMLIPNYITLLGRDDVSRWKLLLMPVTVACIMAVPALLFASMMWFTGRRRMRQQLQKHE